MLIELLKRIIHWITSIIKNKTYLKIIDFINMVIDNNNLSKAYDIYGKTNILDDSIEGIPALCESALKEIQYMKYDESSFSNTLQRISKSASEAIDSITKILDVSLKENVFIRTGGAEFGNKLQEEIVKSDKKYVLELYQDRNFQAFIYQINHYAGGNLASFIRERINSRGMGIYSKFDYDRFNGSNLAKAVLLNKKLDYVTNNIENDFTDYKTNIPINEVITKDLLLKIRSKDKTVIDQIENDARNTLKACENLEKLSEEYYAKLEKVREKLENSNTPISESFVSITESQRWVSLLIRFSQYIFNHELNVLDVSRRATYILCKKANISIERKTVLKPNTTLGYIPYISKKTFEKLSDGDLYKLSRYIMQLQIRKLGGVEKPIYLLIIKNNKNAELHSKVNIGNALGLYSNINDKLIYDMQCQFSSPNINANKINELINKYETIVDKEEYASDDKKCKLKSIVVRLFHNEIINVIQNKRLFIDEYLPAYYFGVIVHEATHVKQIFDIEKTLKESKDMEIEDSEADRRNNNVRNGYKLVAGRKHNFHKVDIIERVQTVHEKFRYSYSNFENEANNEERKFIMSIINSTCKSKNNRDKIEENLVEK
jgi:hypothetical protein